MGGHLPNLKRKEVLEPKLGLHESKSGPSGFLGFKTV